MEGYPDPPELRGIIPNSFRHIFDKIGLNKDAEKQVRRRERNRERERGRGAERKREKEKRARNRATKSYMEYVHTTKPRILITIILVPPPPTYSVSVSFRLSRPSSHTLYVSYTRVPHTCTTHHVIHPHSHLAAIVPRARLVPRNLQRGDPRPSRKRPQEPPRPQGECGQRRVR